MCKDCEKLKDDIVLWWIDSEDSRRRTALEMAGIFVRSYKLVGGDEGSKRFARMKKAVKKLELDRK